jgi:hypothetical protein
MPGVLAEVRGGVDVAVVRFDGDKDELDAEENKFSWLYLGAMFEKFILSAGTAGLASTSYK